jgi:glycosyltransferase involved in cell wall biosynthesis
LLILNLKTSVISNKNEKNLSILLPSVNFNEIIFYSLIIVFACELGYYFFFFLKFSFYRKKETEKTQEPVSVVICARNESRNLLDFLPSVLSQTHKNYEVIVVDDCSADDTEDVLRAFKNKHDNFKFVLLKESDAFSGGKKFALTIGIKAAKYDTVLLTDADCVPLSNEWVERMTSSINSGKQISLGYGAYKKEPTFINKLIRFDAFFIAIQYFSFALAGMPYMGVGRNLAYRKELFFKNKGFANHMYLESGDDDLFINAVSTQNNVAIVPEQNAHTISVPENNFSEWLNQKVRHLTTGFKYKLLHRFLLFFFFLARYLFIGFSVAALVFTVNMQVLAAIWICRILIQMIIFRNAMKKLGETDLLLLAPILELVLLSVYPVFFIMSAFRKKSKWKKI